MQCCTDEVPPGMPGMYSDYRAENGTEHHQSCSTQRDMNVRIMSTWQAAQGC